MSFLSFFPIYDPSTISISSLETGIVVGATTIQNLVTLSYKRIDAASDPRLQIGRSVHVELFKGETGARYRR